MTKKQQSPAPMSLRAYARRRGVSAEAVSKAIMAGRLRASVVTVGGKPKVSDAELADQEWDANTQPRADMPRIEPRAVASEADDVPDYNESRAIREAHAARRESALADLAEIEVREKLEELVPVDEARAYIIDRFAVVKTKVLGVPSRLAQRFPHIATELEPVVDELLREVLEELAAEPDDGDGEVEEKD